jgi:hypothetical protein
VDLYIHSPIRLHGVVLNFLSTGTTLPYIKHNAMGGGGVAPSILNSAVDTSEWSAHATTVYRGRGNTLYSLNTRLSGPGARMSRR